MQVEHVMSSKDYFKTSHLIRKSLTLHDLKGNLLMAGNFSEDALRLYNEITQHQLKFPHKKTIHFSEDKAGHVSVFNLPENTSGRTSQLKMAVELGLIIHHVNTNL